MTQQNNSLIDDPVLEYATEVELGTIIAGPHVRAACKRHLQDMENGHERGLVWDPVAASRVIKFFKFVLSVEIEEKDEFGETHSKAIPFVLAPSQEFIVGSLFGWKRDTGLRRFRRAYVEEGKGNGKSPLGAGIGHYMLNADRKLRAECYCAATDHDQASIPFRDAVAMFDRSAALRRRLVASGIQPVWQLTNPKTHSFYKPISSQKKGKSGIRPHYALLDEIHEHPNNDVIEMLRAGTKGNQQALIFEITNSGFDRNSVCWAEHDYSIKVAAGDVENDAWFSYVCALDEDDEPFEDESCWPKANPLLGVSIQHEFIREQVAETRGLVSKESLVRRLHFCQWTDAADTWINRVVWEKCEADLNLEDYVGQVCYFGLDMSYTTDLSSLAIVFPREDDCYDAFVEFWKPSVGLKESAKTDAVPYEKWAEQGFLNTTEGQVIKLAPIAMRMASGQDKFDLATVAYDRYRLKELEREMAELEDPVELPMIEHPQGFRRGGVLRDIEGEPILGDDYKPVENPLWMPNSFQYLENAIIETKLRVARNPVLRWNVASAVCRQDPAGTDNRIFDKRKSTGRIDGVVALAMALGAATSKVGVTRKSVYEGRGVLVV